MTTSTETLVIGNNRWEIIEDSTEDERAYFLVHFHGRETTHHDTLESALKSLCLALDEEWVKLREMVIDRFVETD